MAAIAALPSALSLQSPRGRGSSAREAAELASGLAAVARSGGTSAGASDPHELAVAALRTFPLERTDKEVDLIWNWVRGLPDSVRRYICRSMVKNDVGGGAEGASEHEPSEADNRYMARHLSLLSLPRGTLVHKQGDFGDSFFIVLRGTVQMRHKPVSDTPGRQIAASGLGGAIVTDKDMSQLGVVVGTLSEGDGFGEQSVAADGAKHASSALSGGWLDLSGIAHPTELLQVDRKSFHRIVAPVFADSQAAIARRVACMRRMIIFEDWPESELSFLASWMEDCQLAPDEPLYRAGSRAKDHSVHFVLKGCVHVIRSSTTRGVMAVTPKANLKTPLRRRGRDGGADLDASGEWDSPYSPDSPLYEQDLSTHKSVIESVRAPGICGLVEVARKTDKRRFGVIGAGRRGAVVASVPAKIFKQLALGRDAAAVFKTAKRVEELVASKELWHRARLQELKDDAEAGDEVALTYELMEMIQRKVVRPYVRGGKVDDDSDDEGGAPSMAALFSPRIASFPEDDSPDKATRSAQQQPASDPLDWNSPAKKVIPREDLLLEGAQREMASVFKAVRAFKRLLTTRTSSKPTAAMRRDMTEQGVRRAHEARAGVIAQAAAEARRRNLSGEARPEDSMPRLAGSLPVRARGGGAGSASASMSTHAMLGLGPRTDRRLHRMESRSGRRFVRAGSGDVGALNAKGASAPPSGAPADEGKDKENGGAGGGGGSGASAAAGVSESAGVSTEPNLREEVHGLYAGSSNVKQRVEAVQRARRRASEYKQRHRDERSEQQALREKRVAEARRRRHSALTDGRIAQSSAVMRGGHQVGPTGGRDSVTMDDLRRVAANAGDFDDDVGGEGAGSSGSVLASEYSLAGGGGGGAARRQFVSRGRSGSSRRAVGGSSRGRARYSGVGSIAGVAGSVGASAGGIALAPGSANAVDGGTVYPRRAASARPGAGGVSAWAHGPAPVARVGSVRTRSSSRSPSPPGGRIGSSASRYLVPTRAALAGVGGSRRHSMLLAGAARADGTHSARGGLADGAGSTQAALRAAVAPLRGALRSPEAAASVARGRPATSPHRVRIREGPGADRAPRFTSPIRSPQPGV